MCGGGGGEGNQAGTSTGGHGQPAGPAGESQARTVEAITARNRASFDRLEARLAERGGAMGPPPPARRERRRGGERLDGFMKQNRIESLSLGESITVGNMTVRRINGRRFAVNGPRGLRVATTNSSTAAGMMPDTGW